MKTSHDPRHHLRKQKVKLLFSYSFQPQLHPQLITPILDKLSHIDALIQQAASEWPLNKINKIDLAILRVGVYELLYANDVPAKVAIDEAVEIAKLYGSQSSPAFVNGVLGTILKNNQPSS